MGYIIEANPQHKIINKKLLILNNIDKFLKSGNYKRSTINVQDYYIVYKPVIIPQDGYGLSGRLTPNVEVARTPT